MAKKAATTSTKKTAAPKATSRKTATQATQGNGAPTSEQIADRAYQIYCRRCQTGEPGNAHSDWMAAESELRVQPAR